MSLHRSAKWHVLQPWTLALCQNAWVFLDLSIHRNTVNGMSAVDLKLAARVMQERTRGLYCRLIDRTLWARNSSRCRVSSCEQNRQQSLVPGVPFSGHHSWYFSSNLMLRSVCFSEEETEALRLTVRPQPGNGRARTRSRAARPPVLSATAR